MQRAKEPILIFQTILVHKRSSAPSRSRDSPPLKTVFLAMQSLQGRGTRRRIKNANERVEQMMENCFIQLHLPLRQLTLRKARRSKAEPLMSPPTTSPHYPNTCFANHQPGPQVETKLEGE